MSEGPLGMAAVVQGERAGSRPVGQAKATFNQTLEATARIVGVPKNFLLSKKRPWPNFYFRKTPLAVPWKTESLELAE